MESANTPGFCQSLQSCHFQSIFRTPHMHQATLASSNRGRGNCSTLGSFKNRNHPGKEKYEQRKGDPHSISRKNSSTEAVAVALISKMCGVSPLPHHNPNPKNSIYLIKKVLDHKSRHYDKSFFLQWASALE